MYMMKMEVSGEPGQFAYLNLWVNHRKQGGELAPGE